MGTAAGASSTKDSKEDQKSEKKKKGPSMLGARGNFTRIAAAAYCVFPILGGSRG